MLMDFSLCREEKQTQERMKEAQRQPQRRQVEKNW